MTTTPLFAALLPVIDDLAGQLPEGERYQRLLTALRSLIPCDAVALLRLDGAQLIPLAVAGLSTDTLGRRFRIDEHPRLAALLDRPGATRFAADCTLPDPYDGLIEAPRGALEVHDCMGCPLRIDEQPWGLVTVDALDPSRFGAADLDHLDAFSRLIAAVIKTVERVDALERRARDEQLLAERYRQMAAYTALPELIGHSAAHKRLLAEIEVVAASELTVLIGGETGTGKELVAQAIHARSPRAQRPLVSINCAALPEALIESELFGHVRGAFSGALSERSGKFELANSGTLFLDEVGELPLAAQAKLLRVLQSGQLQRLGSDREHRVDVRIVAATNRDLADEVRAGRFRADLYHRLSVYPLRVPPLRECSRDVLLLAGHFLEQNRARLRLRGLRLGSEAQAALLAHDWPGNVRELEHLIGRAALKARAGSEQPSRVVSIDLDNIDLTAARPPQEAASTPQAPTLPPAALRSAVADYQRQLIAAALQRAQGSWAAAARELGLDRGNLQRLASRLGIARADAAGDTARSGGKIRP